MTNVLGFVLDNFLFVITGLTGAAGLLILALVWMGVLPGHDLLRLPKATGLPGAEPEPPPAAKS